ncbi:hypothetical protein CAEBREN_03020 [Caenorhabditis brenneri]|uniref:Tc1-like transposase DDE domain-containing protein n=1 Tax=Caenorhabditis brenneri TaxID=135651 RepID=G0N2V5_CAEBE|nr:hypothetical protein CAEBREN_03020 [Caenorhabditis brenneri]
MKPKPVAYAMSTPRRRPTRDPTVETKHFRSKGLQVHPRSRTVETQTREPKESSEKKFTEIGKIIHSLTLDQFPKIQTDKILKHSGEEIVNHLSGVLNTIKTALGEYAKETIFNAPIQCLSAFTGFHRDTVAKYSSNVPLEPRPEKEDVEELSKREKCRSIAARLTVNERMKIRKRIHELWRQKGPVNVELLWQWAKKAIGFRYSQTYFRLTMLGMGLRYKKNTRMSALEERSDIAKLRIRYLEAKLFAEDDDPFFVFFDETWIHDGFGNIRDWQYENATGYQKARMVDPGHPIPGPYKPKHRGKRGITLGMLTEDGLIPESIKFIISGGKPEAQLADYHQEMNAENYKLYMEEMVPIIARLAAQKGKNGYIIIDNAPYHNITRTKPPTMANLKDEICFWLMEHSIRFNYKSKKEQLMSLVKSHIEANGGREAFVVYEVDSWAEEVYGVRIIRLPPYHCHWNPIEFVWADLKSHLRKFGDPSDKLEIVRNRALNFLQTYDSAKALSVMEHCRRDEEDVREMLEEQELMVEDENWKLVYDVKENGQLVNVHFDDDEDWTNEQPSNAVLQCEDDVEEVYLDEELSQLSIDEEEFNWLSVENEEEQDMFEDEVEDEEMPDA